MTYSEEVRTRPDGSLTKKEEAKRIKRNLQEVIDIVWHMPVREEVLEQAQEGMSIASLRGKNVDAMTVAVMAQVDKAMGGDRDAFVNLAKYGGYEPVQKTEVSCITPNFVYQFNAEDDDKVLSDDELLARARKISIESAEKDKDNEQCQQILIDQ